MSNSSARRPPCCSSGAQLSKASSASSRGEMTSKRSPVWRWTRLRKAGALAARAAGFGGDGAHADPGIAGEAVGASLQGGHGAAHTAGAELSGFMEPLAQADDTAEAVEHAEAARGGCCDQ